MNAQTFVESVPAARAPSPQRRRRRAARRGRSILGGFYLTMAGINIGLLVADPAVYTTFGDRSLFEFVRTGWLQIVMASPVPWIAALAAGEILIGAALLSGGWWAVAGYGAVIVFHLCLLLFGWGVWLWSMPVLAVVVPLALRQYRLVRRSS
jgi:hypothetical protein